MRLAAAATLLATAVRAEDYVAFQQLATTGSPEPRALAATVLQHTVAENAALGRYAWVFGGLDAAMGALNDLWMLDMQTNAWTQRAADGASPAARRGSSFVVLSQRSAYLFGGESASRTRFNDMHLLHLGSGTTTTPRWEAIVYNSTSVLPPARTEHTATVVPLVEQVGDPLGMLVFGGADDSSRPLDDLYEFDFATLSWRALSPSGTPPPARKGHSSCLLLNSLLAVFGGANQEVPTVYSDVHLYDLHRNTWLQTTAVGSELPAARDGHSMVAIEQTVYIFGGVNAKGEKMDDLWAFNAYSAVSGQLQWSRPAAMSAIPPARWGHAAIVSVGSMLLLNGAANGDGLLSDSWLMTAGCSGNMTLTSARGAFTDGEGYYLNNLDCRWVMSPDVANSNVLLFFSTLDIVDSNDRLDIYDGASTAAPLVASYTGSAIPPSIVSTGGSMLLHFTTDAAGEAGIGFEASYQAVCARGHLYDAVSAGCSACPAGSYNNVANAAECLPCPAGFYAPFSGSTSCTQCPAYSTTSTQGSYQLEACICQPGYYGVDNACAVCAEGAECPGGNLMRARAGWCELTSADAGVASTFYHCCTPELCPGGVAAVCDNSMAKVGVDDCAVRYLTWDTIHLVSISEATWITCLIMLLLLLLLCFCGGSAMGWRRAIRRFEHRVIPTVRMPPGGTYGGGGAMAHAPPQLDPVDPVEYLSKPQTASTVTPPQQLELVATPDQEPSPLNRPPLGFRRRPGGAAALEPGSQPMRAGTEALPSYGDGGRYIDSRGDDNDDLVIVSLEEPPPGGSRSVSAQAQARANGAGALPPDPATDAQVQGLIEATKQATARLFEASALDQAQGNGGSYDAAFVPMPSSSQGKSPKRKEGGGNFSGPESKPLLEATPPGEEEEPPTPESEPEPEPEPEPKKGKKAKKAKESSDEEEDEEEEEDTSSKKKKGKKGKKGSDDEDGEDEGGGGKKKKKGKKSDSEEEADEDEGSGKKGKAKKDGKNKPKKDGGDDGGGEGKKKKKKDRD